MSLTRQALQRSKCCRMRWPTTAAWLCDRSFSTSVPRVNDAVTDAPKDAASYTPETSNEGRPRWSYTPERMKAPFSIQQPKDPRRSIWKVNDNPDKLDRMYEKFIGRDLARSLPDELKWLAVTHKSFDNGRRGFNTRLAFFGRLIVASETTRAIMGSPEEGEQARDPYGREPFEHPALKNVDKLNTWQPHHLANPEKIAHMAKEIGLPGVVRWKPRMPDNLEGSGETTVLTSTIFAIVGAISLHHGAEAASRVVSDRIIKRLST